MNISSIKHVLHEFMLSTRPKPWPQEKPTVLQFPVNDICNSKCQMCNIWKQKLDKQITPDQLTNVLSNQLFTEIHGVGVNGGEPTLRSDLAELVDVLFRCLPKLKGISLITNGLNSEQVMNRIEEVGNIVVSHEGILDVMVSLDGVETVHDTVRGQKGNFDEAVHVIDFIQNFPLVTFARLGCTVIRDNVFGVHDLLEFAIQKDIPITFRLGIPHQRLYSDSTVEPFALNDAEKYHLAIFLENLCRYYESSPRQRDFYRSLIGQMIHGLPRRAGCDWQHRGVTLTSRGELLYCAVASNTLGNAIETDPSHLYFGNESHLHDIIASRCDGCMHDYVGIPDTSVLLDNYGDRLLQTVGIEPVSVKSSAPIMALREHYRSLRFRRHLRTIYPLPKQTLDKQPATQFSRSAPRKKVLICGWYGTETLGDKAILAATVNAIVASLAELGVYDSRIYIVSLDSYITSMTVTQMHELNGCHVLSINEAPEQLADSDLLVFGGGPLMAIEPMADMLNLFRVARHHNVPSIVAGCGVGPLGQNPMNKVIRELLESASYRIYRDNKSSRNARLLGIDTSSDSIAEDPAFSWLDSLVLASSPHANNTAGKPRLLLGLREWPYRQYAPELSKALGSEIEQGFRDEILSTLRTVAKETPDLEIVPLPMCTNHHGGDDRWYYRSLFRESPDIADQLNLTFINQELSPAEAVKVFQSANAILAMRYHSLVFALGLGLPAVAIDYTLGRGKVASLGRQFNVPTTNLRDVTSQELVQHIGLALSQRDSAESVMSNMPDFRFNTQLHNAMISLFREE